MFKLVCLNLCVKPVCLDLCVVECVRIYVAVGPYRKICFESGVLVVCLTCVFKGCVCALVCYVWAVLD
mgnify:CR=1 FL=1